jgi:hypothetical protein
MNSPFPVVLTRRADRHFISGQHAVVVPIVNRKRLRALPRHSARVMRPSLFASISGKRI